MRLGLLFRTSVSVLFLHLVCLPLPTRSAHVFHMHQHHVTSPGCGAFMGMLVMALILSLHILYETLCTFWGD